jgi:hypothetical protein
MLLGLTGVSLHSLPITITATCGDGYISSSSSSFLSLTPTPAADDDDSCSTPSPNDVVTCWDYSCDNSRESGCPGTHRLLVGNLGGQVLEAVVDWDTEGSTTATVSHLGCTDIAPTYLCSSGNSTHLLTYSLTHLLTLSLTHSLVYSLVFSLIYSFIYYSHFGTHSLTHLCLICSLLFPPSQDYSGATITVSS